MSWLDWQSHIKPYSPSSNLLATHRPGEDLNQLHSVPQNARAQVGDRCGVGQHRTLYSLRHSAMTFRLLYGRKVDLLTLAKNARTSVEMVERFYSSNLDAEMNIDLLHGKR